jgi:structural maintenance of chromosome 2
MFSNANVIFRTKFVDGVSAITRTVPSAAEAAMRGGSARGVAATTPGSPQHGNKCVPLWCGDL